MSEPTEHELKIEYAQMIVEDDGQTSARSVADDLLRKYYPSYDYRWCDYIAKNWTKEEIVITEIKRLKSYVPTAAEVISTAYRKASHKNTSPQDAAKLLQVAANAMGLGKVKAEKDDTKGKDRLTELAAMVLGTNDSSEETTEETPVESEANNGVLLT